MSGDSFGFEPSPEAHSDIQWKGTDVCMDFRCECGGWQHVDGFFAYTVECEECGISWEMPHRLFPRKKEKAA